MSQPFAFPPPPPPPQTGKDAHSYTQYQTTSFVGRGRGGARGNYFRGSHSSRAAHSGGRGRGYGQYPRGQPLGVEHQAATSYTSNSTGQQHRPNGSRNENPSASYGAVPSSKRNHSAAFGNHDTSNNRPRAPPAVPSFNADLENLLPARRVIEKPHKTAPAKKSNLLGLTPSTQEPEDQSDGDDGDDEARMATAVAQDGYTFSHKGQTMSLRNPEEIAAWIAERRKRYPTKDKIEAARQEAEAKKRQREELKREREAAAKIKLEERKGQRKQQETERLKQGLLARAMARSKAEIAKKHAHESKSIASSAEILSQRVERAAQQLKKAEEALRKAQARVEAGENQLTHSELKTEVSSELPQPGPETGFAAPRHPISPEMLPHEEPDVSTDLSAESLADDTSTSGSSVSGSENESDSAPEEFSTQRSGPDRVSPAKIKPTVSNERRLCNNLARFGNCRFGKKCHYSHEVPRKEGRSKSNHVTSSTKRKSLYQIMVEREQEIQQQAVLTTIVRLGQQGLLADDVETSKDGDGPSFVPVA